MFTCLIHRHPKHIPSLPLLSPIEGIYIPLFGNYSSKTRIFQRNNPNPINYLTWQADIPRKVFNEHHKKKQTEVKEMPTDWKAQASSSISSQQLNLRQHIRQVNPSLWQDK